MTADVELLPLPEPDVVIAGQIVSIRSDNLLKGWSRACVEANTAAKNAEIEALRAKVEWMREVARKANETADLAVTSSNLAEAEVKRLQEIVRPKREDECLTLDHWRMRAYDLEANWDRTCRAANAEATARKEAVALAERLAEALRDIESVTRDSGGYVHDVARAALRPTTTGESIG